MAEKFLVIALSSDLDWAPDAAVDYFLDVLDEYVCKITIFGTHKINYRKHEISLHPNTFKHRDHLDAIKEVHRLFPEAKGVRMHGLRVWSRLLLDLPKFNLRYDSSYFMPDQKIEPYEIFPGVFELPIFWEDDLAMIRGSLKVDKQRLKEQQDSNYLYLYNFHPIHVYMNTYDMNFYDSWKDHYQHTIELEKRKNSDRYGTCDALKDLLDTIDTSRLSTMTEIIDDRLRT